MNRYCEFYCGSKEYLFDLNRMEISCDGKTYFVAQLKTDYFGHPTITFSSDIEIFDDFHGVKIPRNQTVAITVRPERKPVWKDHQPEYVI